VGFISAGGRLFSIRRQPEATKQARSLRLKWRCSQTQRVPLDAVPHDIDRGRSARDAYRVPALLVEGHTPRIHRCTRRRRAHGDRGTDQNATGTSGL